MAKTIFLFCFLALLSLKLIAQTVIFPFKSSWKYLDNGSDQGTAWRAPAYNDSGWNSGNGILGYGMTNLGTVVSYGPDKSNKYITTYFRKAFSISDASTLASLDLSVLRDDGVVVYINGQEVYRDNMPTGTITYTTLALKSSNNTKYKNIPASTLINGTNVIAVEVHQQKVTSSDMAFDLELKGIPSSVDQVPPTVMSINRQNPTTEVTSATSVTYRAFFSEKVTGVDAQDFTLTTVSGSATGHITTATAVGTDGTSYDVTVGSISGTGTIRLDLKASGTGIADMAGNAISGGFTGGQSYTIQQALSETSSELPVYFKSSWKYLDNGSDQGTAWRSASFDDSGWMTGNGEFGYGDGDEATVVSFGPDASNKYITTYFRKIIYIADVTAYTSFTANIKRDDGAVVYVNGVEVLRDNMPTGTINYRILASSSSDITTAFTIDPSAFVNGNNIVAIEVHQVSKSSSDISFDLELLGKGGTQLPLLTRGPYLQVASKTAITLRWRTDVATDSKVEVGTESGTFTQSATNSTITTEHEVRITNLKENTKYYYRIGSSTQALQSGTSNYFYTAPPSNTTRKIRIAVFGDSGKDSKNNRTGSLNTYLNFTAGNPGELLLLLGDNAYPDGTDAEYQKEFFNPFNGILKNHVVFPSPGNHDYHSVIPATARDVGGYYTSFSMPTAGESGGVASGNKAYYSFDWGNIHFISLDSEGVEPDNTKLYDTLGTQAKWLKKDLEANIKKWVVVYFHHPPYTMGSHNSDTESRLIKIRQRITPILERYGVDLVLAGHSHNYERSYLLSNYTGDETSFNITTHTKSSSSANYDGSPNSCAYVTTSTAKRNGTVYVVAGSGGASGIMDPSFPHSAMPFAVDDGGMLYLEVEDNRLDGKMLRKDGTVFDKFTIMQDVNLTTTITTAPGSSTQLTASWIGTYKWSTGATTRTITVSPSSSTTYRVTDNNGCLTDVFNVNTTTTLASSGTQSLHDEQQLLNYLEVYPTLAKRGSVIHINSNDTEPSKAFVSDITGRILYTLDLSGGASIETSYLPSGMYIVSPSGKGQAKKKKFIVVD